MYLSPISYTPTFYPPIIYHLLLIYLIYLSIQLSSIYINSSLVCYLSLPSLHLHIYYLLPLYVYIYLSTYLLSTTNPLFILFIIYLSSSIWEYSYRIYKPYFYNYLFVDERSQLSLYLYNSVSFQSTLFTTYYQNSIERVKIINLVWNQVNNPRLLWEVDPFLTKESTNPSQTECLPNPLVVWIIEEGQECPLFPSSRCSFGQEVGLSPGSLSGHYVKEGPCRTLKNLSSETHWNPSMDLGHASDVATIWLPQEMLVQLVWEGWEWDLGTQTQKPRVFLRHDVRLWLSGET